MCEVLLRLIGSGVTALPIHDAVIVGEPHQLKAQKVMREVFREMSGVEAVVTISDHPDTLGDG
jgi:hypothetical protein